MKTILTIPIFLLSTLHAYSQSCSGPGSLTGIPANFSVILNNQCSQTATVVAPTFTLSICSSCLTFYTISPNNNDFIPFAPGSTLTFTFFGTGTTTIRWFTLSQCSDGNFVLAGTTVVTKIDNTPPFFTTPCPQNYTFNAPSNACSFTTPPPVFSGSTQIFFRPNFSDNCSSTTITNNYNNSNNLNNTTFPVGITTVTWTITDGSGNTATCIWTITVLDVTPPEIVCPTSPLIFGTNVGCQANVILPPPSSLTDNCPGVTFNTIPQPPFNLGNTTVTYIATDASGNTSSCTRTITVVDDDPPVLVCPNDYTVAVSGITCQTTLTQVEPLQSLSDNCTPTSNILVQLQPPLPITIGIGNNIITYRAFDNAQNMGTCTFRIIGVDVTPPTINCPPPFVVPTSPMQCLSNFTPTGATAVDNCSPPVTLTLLTPPPYPVGTSNLIFRATDNVGNSATCTTTITVNDTEPPTIQCPGNFTVSTDPGTCAASNVSFPPPTTNDNCQVDFFTVAPTGPFPLGVNNITYTVFDIYGNSKSCTMKITVVDTEAPQILACPEDIEVDNTPGLCAAIVILDIPEAVDNCTPTPLLIHTNNAPPGNLFPVGTTPVSFKVTDAAGNSVTCMATVQVNDVEPPTIVCPQNITLVAAPDECFGYDFIPPPAIKDNCINQNSTFDIIQDPNPPNGAFPVGNTVVTFYVSDFYGNLATCSLTVTVLDLQPPQIFCPDTIFATTSPNSCLATVHFPPARAVDNCPQNLKITPPKSPQTFGVGTFFEVYVASDGTNTTTCQVVVVVTGASNISITCPPDLTVSTDTNQCFATLSLNATAAAACGLDTIISNAPATFPVGTTVVTFTALDLAGQTAVCTTAVTVQDLQFPQFICPPAITQPTDSGLCTATVRIPAPQFSDNCPIGWTIPGDTILNNLPIGNPSTIFTFVAFNGNDSVFCSVSITITGTTQLSITCPADTTIYSSVDNCSVRFIPPNPTVLSDCGLDTLFSNAPALFPLGITPVVFTAISLNGDSVTCTMNVEVKDSIAPFIACPPTIIQQVDNNACTATVDPQFFAFDNCDSSVVVTYLPPNPFPLGTTIATATATDDSGNQSTCTFLVVVVENIPPTLTCPTNITANNDPGECFATLNLAHQILISDNCGRTDSLVGQVSGQFPVGQNTIVLTAFDGNGNSATCQILIEVLDNEPPTITCPNDIVQGIDPTGCKATVVIPPATASDNCIFPVVPTGPTGGIFPIGTHTVFFSATAGGLTATCSVQITITGTTNLNITCPADVSVSNDPNACFATLNLPQPTVIADCGLISISNNAPAQFPIGATTVTFVALDAIGNTATCSMQVVVNDVELPQLICPNGFTIAATVGNCEAVVNFPSASISDNCPIIPQNLTSNLQPGSQLPVGQHVVTYTYTDLLGVTATCSFTIIVVASPTSLTLDAVICEGSTFSAGGQTFNATGTYTLTLTNLAGCDSLLTIHLRVIPSIVVSRDTSICAGDSIFLAGKWQKIAGIYRDTFLQSNGCDSIVNTTLTIKSNPIVTIMGPLTLCPGNLVTLSVMMFQQYLWSGGQTTQQINVSQPGVYSVTVTDDQGCRGSDEIDILEYCGVVKANFKANYDTICTDFFIQFTDLSTGIPTPPNRWLWNFGNGNFSHQKNPFTYYPSPGVYPVTLIVSDGIVSDTITKNIVIYQKPKANFSYTVPDKCRPREIQYTSIITSIHPLQSIFWNLGDGNTSHQANPKHLYKQYDTVATSLIIRDKFGCTDSIRQDVRVSPNAFAPEPVLLTPVLCPGESITINGIVYDANNLSGETKLTSFHGCDSIVRVQLSFIPGGNLFLGNDTTICSNQTLTLDAGNAAQYLWSTGQTTRTITVSQAGTYSVFIFGNNGNCSAQGSIKVNVDALPNLKADAGFDQQVCALTTNFIQLSATAPNIGTGQWTSLGTAVVDNPTSPKSFVTNLTSGNNRFVWSLSNGQCKNYSRDTVVIQSVTIAQSANAGDNIAFCAAGDIKLNATAPAVGLGRWSQPAGQNLSFSNINDPKATLSGVVGTNIYTLFWTVDNGVCPDSTDQVLVSRSPVVLAAANAGSNQTLCDQNFIQLQGNQVPGTTGKWSFVGPAGTASISTPNSPTTNVTNISPGVIRLAWTLSGVGAAGCANYSADTIVILQSGGLKAENDVYKAEGQPLKGLNFIANDQVGTAELINTPILLTTPSVGTLTANPDGTFDFVFGQVEPTTVSFRYRICLKKCPDVCSDATVKIVTNEPIPPIQRPANVFTPNRDGVADYFEIPNFDQIPITLPITLLVVNRWGDVLFYTDRYDNRWEGTDNNGNPIADGTYFFVLEGGGGEGPEKRVSGYVTIMR